MLPTQNIHLSINICSTGGAVNAAFAVYNYLKSLPFPVQTNNLGDVSSAALLFYLAGSTRVAENVSKFMIHPVELTINEALSYFKVEQLLYSLELDIKHYCDIINQETNCLNGKYDVEHYLKTESIFFEKQSAYDCGIITQL